MSPQILPQLLSVKKDLNAYVFVVAMLLSLLSFRPVTTGDALYGIKIGEQFLQARSIADHDMLSWSTTDRHWIAYEWLFQTLLGGINIIGGLWAISFFNSVVVGCFFLLSYRLLTKVFDKNALTSLTLSLLLVASIYEFFVPRPQIAVFVLLLFTQYLILNFIIKNKNVLWLTLPITYVWANSHGSFVFMFYFLFSYAFFGCLYYWRQDRLKSLTILKQLSLCGALCIAVTFLPPLSHKLYLNLWQFSQQLSYVSQSINEWQPLYFFPAYTVYYVITVMVSALIFFLLFLKKKLPRYWVLGVPLLPIIVFSFTAFRHFPLGIIATYLLVGIWVPSIKNRKVAWVLLFFIVLFSTSFILHKRAVLISEQTAIPNHLIKFLQQHHLKGKMFNHPGHGGFYAYWLYPAYSVFMDGRFELYHCCELRDFWDLVQNKNASEQDFTRLVSQFLDKYHFSYLIIPIQSSTPTHSDTLKRVSSVIQADPDWKLIYFDDQNMFFLNNDHRNDKIFQQYQKTAISPLDVPSFSQDQLDKAITEYQQQLLVQESGLAYTGLAEVQFAHGDLETAKTNFKQALAIQPQLGRSYLGLAKIALAEGNTVQAVKNLRDCIVVSSDIGESYLLLAQLLDEIGRDSEVKLVLEQGLEANVDLLSRQKMMQMLITL